MALARPFAKNALILSLAFAILAGCGDSDPVPERREVAQRIENEGIAEQQGDTIGTPMVERVAILGLLNKRNGRTRDIELKPGQALRIGDRVVVRLRACEKTAPWENHPEQGAFVQLLVNERQVGDNNDNWTRVFSGWLFKENPALNVVQHPVYDVWVKECRMSFPGEEDSSPALAEPSAAPAPASESSESSADQSPAPEPSTEESTAE